MGKRPVEEGAFFRQSLVELLGAGGITPTVEAAVRGLKSLIEANPEVGRIVRGDCWVQPCGEPPLFLAIYQIQHAKVVLLKAAHPRGMP